MYEQIETSSVSQLLRISDAPDKFLLQKYRLVSWTQCCFLVWAILWLPDICFVTKLGLLELVFKCREVTRNSGLSSAFRLSGSRLLWCRVCSLLGSALRAYYKNRHTGVLLPYNNMFSVVPVTLDSMPPFIGSYEDQHHVSRFNWYPFALTIINALMMLHFTMHKFISFAIHIFCTYFLVEGTDRLATDIPNCTSKGNLRWHLSMR